LPLSIVDRDSLIPLYYQIQRQLLAKISAGELKAGDPLLSEQQLSAHFKVSRMTARQALKSLCHLGVAYSLQGKGTFVSGLRLDKNFRQVQSFTEEMAALGLRPSSKVLTLEVIPAARSVAEVLHLSPGEELIRVRRLRLANSSPMGIECSYLPHRVCPGLLETFDGRSSLYRALWERYGIRVQCADEVVEVGLADSEEAKLLRLRNSSPVFWFTRVSYVRDGPPVEYVKSTYRGDRYRIVNRLTRLEM
jgi:GntR family transcriptional regulator